LHLVARLSKIQPSTDVSGHMTSLLLTHLLHCYPDSYHGILGQLLLEPDCFGSTPLHVAAVTSNCACLELLLLEASVKGGNIPVARDNDGYHPTFIACVEFARTVNDIGITTAIAAATSVSAAAVAEEEEGEELLLLQTRGQRLSSCLLTLLRVGYPLDSTDYSSNTLFHSLAYCPSSELLDSLLTAIIEQFSSSEEQLFLLQRVLETSNDARWTCFHVALAQSIHTSRPDNGTNSGANLDTNSFYVILFKLTSASFQASFDPSQSKVVVDISSQLVLLMIDLFC
jgi:hypothetical protein